MIPFFFFWLYENKILFAIEEVSSTDENYNNRDT